MPGPTSGPVGCFFGQLHWSTLRLDPRAPPHQFVFSPEFSNFRKVSPLKALPLCIEQVIPMKLNYVQGWSIDYLNAINLKGKVPPITGLSVL